jgi:hypothetical protein
MEEAYKMKNYLTCVKKKLSLLDKIEKTIKKPCDTGVTEHARSFGIQKIFSLHQSKDYKEETLFIAANIFDRYIACIGPLNF